MRPKFFKTEDEFRQWLEKNHSTVSELLVGFFKTATGRGGMTYKKALDQALCYGWIDGVRRNFDLASYTIRFTPRKSRSHWSRVNIKRASELKALGMMHVSGVDAFEKRDEGKTINYSYELRAASLGQAYERRFKKNARAWAFFQSQAPSYQRHAKFWVTSAKKEETRDRRFAALMADSEAGRRLSITTPGKHKRN